MSYLAEGKSIFTGNYSQSFGLGYECELIERAAKAQIIKYLPEITEKLQNIWNHRDKEFEEFTEESKPRIIIPKVERVNIISGLECFSILQSPITRWPNISIYARDATSYIVQEDHWDTSNLPLNIEIMCLGGPVKTEEIHDLAGIEVMVNLNSELQRLSDAVYECIQKDTTLSGTVGQFEKPPKATVSLPAVLKEQIQTTTGESYIFQGKQFSWIVQKITY